MSDAVEQRTSARRGAVANRIVLRFAGSMGYCRVEATLVNISPAGALIVTRERPALNQPLWISMEGPVSTGWVEAVAVRFDEEDQVGLTFGGPGGCGSHFLWAATSGMDMDRLINSEGPNPPLG
jgi:hypothetical protein